MPSEKEILEKEIIEARNILTKIQQDIQEFNARRSNLQNEIEEKLKEAAEKIKSAYIEQEKRIKEKQETLDKQVIETNALLGRTEASISTQEEDIKAEWERITRENKSFQKEKDDFEEYKKSEIRKIEEKKSVLARDTETNALVTQAQEEVTKQQDAQQYELDNLKFQADYSIKENKALLNDIISQQSRVDGRYQAIRKEREGITSEKDIILAKLLELKEQEEKLSQLVSLPDDIVKLEKLKAEVEAISKQNTELSKSLAKKKEELNEREQTLNEKQRLLIIDMRTNDDKIMTIQRLRDDLKKNA